MSRTAVLPAVLSMITVSVSWLVTTVPFGWPRLWTVQLGGSVTVTPVNFNDPAL